MSTLAPGLVVDGFVLAELLGSGGMGDVWAARDQRLGRRVALKFLRTRGDARAVARFLEEARLTARVQHPNVVTVFAAGEWRGRPWLAMELLDGLDGVGSTGRWPWARRCGSRWRWRAACSLGTTPGSSTGT